MVVSVKYGLLTIDVRDVALAEVLQAIGDQAALGVTLRGDLGVPVTEAFTDVPLEDGIRRLTNGHSLALTYATPPAQGTRGSLTAIWVMAGSPAPRASATPAIGRQSTSIVRGGGSGTSGAAAGPAVTGGRGDQATPDEASDALGWSREIRKLADEAGAGSATAITSLADLGASDPDPTVRRQAIAALGRLSGPAIEPVLTTALADAEVLVRIEAVRGLRRAGTDASVQSLAGVAREDADPQVRLAALRALASIPGHPMLEGLLAGSTDPDPRVRETATRGLSWWKPRLSP